MSGHLTRNRLRRCIAGAMSLLILTCIAIFSIRCLKTARQITDSQQGSRQRQSS